jgi:hypothetical protein
MFCPVIYSCTLVLALAGAVSSSNWWYFPLNQEQFGAEIDTVFYNVSFFSELLPSSYCFLNFEVQRFSGKLI